jgi:hypothetical protein
MNLQRRSGPLPQGLADPVAVVEQRAGIDLAKEHEIGLTAAGDWDEEIENAASNHNEAPPSSTNVCIRLEKAEKSPRYRCVTL